MACSSSSEPPCKIGQLLNEECHRDTYTRKQGFINVCDLSEEDRQLLEWRCGLEIQPQDKICLHHEKIKLSFYERLQKYCADPFSAHKKRVTRSLKVVTLQKARLWKLVPGQKLCMTCVLRQEEITLPESYQKSTDEDYENDDIDELNRTLESLNCTPLKKYVSKRDKINYVKNKIKRVNQVVNAKCAKALDVSLDESEQDDAACSDCSDMEQLISLLQTKMCTASRLEKIKLLTLVPESWSREKTMNEFGVTEHMVRRARKLKKERGVLADPEAKQGRSLSIPIIDRVESFFESDDCSRMCPGKKECISVRINGRKEQKQKRLLLVNIKELYIEYTRKYPLDRVGFSKFCELRPKWCVPVTSTGMHSVCVCQLHQNVKLMTSIFPGNTDYKEYIGMTVCSTESRNCMLHLCDICPGKLAISEHLKNVFDAHDFDHDDDITYKQWVHTDRTTLVTLTTSVQEFIDLASDAIDNLRQRHYIAKSQSSYLRNLKEELEPDSVVVLLDFAENYSFIVQDAVQGHHWNNAQATLHPFVFYYRPEGETSCLTMSLCVISDCLKHDTVTVHSFIATVISKLKTFLPNVTKVIYFSDGAASQYKNYKNFSNLCHHKKDFGLDAEWHFFATSHGKSPCDGIGGTVKRLVARASLQATTDGHILTSREMYQWASENIPGVTFFYISGSDVSDNALKFDLASRFDLAKKVTGTRSHHCFIPISEVSLQMKRVSADTDFTHVCSGEETLDQRGAVPAFHDQLQPGRYTACLYDSDWYVGVILERSDDEHDVRVDFMKRSRTGRLSWPAATRKDVCWVPFQHIICLIDAPERYGARSYKLSPKDDKLIQDKFPSFLPLP